MTIVNHAAAGAVIALTVKQPYLVLPLAVLSHFAMDALPHFGYPGHIGYARILKHRLPYLYIFLDIVGWVFLIRTMYGLSWLPFTAAFAAISPDLIRDLWRLVFHLGPGRKGKEYKRGPITRFHRQIQWCERPWGLIIEVIVAVILISLVAKLK